MKRIMGLGLVAGWLGVMTAGCAWTKAGMPVDTVSVQPGGTVTLRGTPQQLTGTPIGIGEPLPAVTLVDAFAMKKTDLATLKGKVLVVSVVPSIDTKVCEAQTHSLGEVEPPLPEGVIRITISRDTPFAQKRFAEEAKLTAITFLSDYREGAFGKATGLLQADSMLLARAVIVTDRDGIVRYLQVVPELTHLPDMAAAFAMARELAGGK